jgi:hypothetical protein
MVELSLGAASVSRQPRSVCTTEAEYMAAAHAVKEGLWLRKLLGDLSMHIDTVAVFADNQSAIKLLEESHLHPCGASTLM